MSTAATTTKKVKKGKDDSDEVICIAMTKLGTKCTRKAVEGTMCKTHNKISTSEKTSETSTSTENTRVFTCEIEDCEEYTTSKLCYRHR
jgi:hypothetical protein